MNPYTWRTSIKYRLLVGIPLLLLAWRAISATLLVDNVQVQSCGAVWTTHGQWIACVIKRDGFDGP